mmetsp:Transcript_83965/g.213759  ORF Transcript_83965/g.213759 Transcript_83965/m.213759 type:complete len:244 (+) Transcript_83965:828-1559(+)
MVAQLGAELHFGVGLRVLLGPDGGVPEVAAQGRPHRPLLVVWSTDDLVHGQSEKMEVHSQVVQRRQQHLHLDRSLVAQVHAKAIEGGSCSTDTMPHRMDDHADGRFRDVAHVGGALQNLDGINRNVEANHFQLEAGTPDLQVQIHQTLAGLEQVRRKPPHTVDLDDVVLGPDLRGTTGAAPVRVRVPAPHRRAELRRRTGDKRGGVLFALDRETPRLIQRSSGQLRLVDVQRNLARWQSFRAV